MKTKIISWLSCMAVLAFLLHSCRHDELTNPENSSQNGSSLAAKYASKSPWKEDEVYIGKVQQVFLKHANLPRVNETYGELHWEYAMSFGQFGERYALVPVVKNNKVTLIMEAVRKENKVYFYEKKDADLLQFFNYLLYSPTSDYTETTNGADTTGKAKYVCTTRTLIVGCPSEISDCVPITSSQMVCEWKEDLGSGIPPQTFDPCGDPFGGGCGGGGSDGGFEYPEPPQETPCEKTKNKIVDPKFKAKFQELNTPEMFAMDHEKGYYERLPPVGSTGIPSGFPVVDGPPCTHGMDLPDNENGIAGLMHIHNDFTCDGNPSVKVPSPSDVRTFLNIFMKQARIYTGSYTNAYSVVITSQGSYMLQYNNDTWPGSTWDKLDDWNKWYIDKFERLTENQLSDPAELEKIFTQFLEEKVAIDGLEVYKITENSSTKLKYNGANQPVAATPCPQ
jgi:hypothetical protein